MTHGQIVEKNQGNNSAMLSIVVGSSVNRQGGTAESSCRRLLPNKLADLLELRRAGAAAPFEQRGFGRRQRRARGIHAPKGDVMIDWTSGADGIGRHIDAKSLPQEIMYRLADTDMRFDSADQDLPNAPVAPASKDLAALTTAKGLLRRDGVEQPGNLRRGRA